MRFCPDAKLFFMGYSFSFTFGSCVGGDKVWCMRKESLLYLTANLAMEGMQQCRQWKQQVEPMFATRQYAGLNPAPYHHFKGIELLNE